MAGNLNKNNEEKFKEWALLSGFPLENDIYNVLKDIDKNIEISRDVEFFVEKDGEKVLRSIDFSCSLAKYSQNIAGWSQGGDEKIELQLLIDAKYSKDDERYMFIPSSSCEISIPCLIPKLKTGSAKSSLTNFSNRKFDYVASNAKKIKELSQERSSVTPAAIQISQGLCYFLNQKAESLGQTSSRDLHYGRNAYFFLPIIVTNVPLLLLKAGVTVREVQDATMQEAIFEKTPFIAMEIPHVSEINQAFLIAETALFKSFHKELEWFPLKGNRRHLIFCHIDNLEQLLKIMIKEFLDIN